eukprot:TRINITY_DN64626_c0_g1_i1.p1 TRINITY_DN64626_c0_g1~~TRINITY_DN64626_c0_g1_i1.p1  ORF type:complete len:326 (+),score=76.93 TRINITY_DN64626_c0_g1_i1:81-1058(+)
MLYAMRKVVGAVLVAFSLAGRVRFIEEADLLSPDSEKSEETPSTAEGPGGSTTEETLSIEPIRAFDGEWLTISKSRSGSFFSEKDNDFFVLGGVVTESDKDDAEEVGTLSFAEANNSNDEPVLKFQTEQEIWRQIGSVESAEEKCTAWNDYRKLLETMKKAREQPPASMSALVQTAEDDEVTCVDFVFERTTSSQPEGWASLAQIDGERTMHWIRKPISEDDIAEVMNAGVMKLTKDVMDLAPASSFEGAVSWASAKALDLIRADDNDELEKAEALVRSWADKSDHALGMSAQTRELYIQTVLELVRPLKEFVNVKLLKAQESPF